MKKIKLSGPSGAGRCAIVDDADYEFLSGITWQMVKRHESTHLEYARGYYNGKTIYMHRLILGAGIGSIVDHINHNGLDNRRSNLRFCSATINLLNRHHKVSGSRGRYIGVYWDAGRKKWRASIQIENKIYRLRRFASQEMARDEYESAKNNYLMYGVLPYEKEKNTLRTITTKG